MSDNDPLDPSNPYSAPDTSTTHGTSDTSAPRNNTPASRLTRLKAVLVDGIVAIAIYFAIYIPIFFLAGPWGEPGKSIFFIGIFLIINGYLLVTRGQTVGKLLNNIQIVDAKSSQLLPFFRVCVLRYLWFLPLVFLTYLIPEQFRDYLPNSPFAINALLIFGPERRCLHDYIAGSRVYDYEEGRSHIK